MMSAMTRAGKNELVHFYLLTGSYFESAHLNEAPKDVN